jgi:tetratricopeptide (TPR) repeat protein
MIRGGHRDWQVRKLGWRASFAAALVMLAGLLNEAISVASAQNNLGAKCYASAVDMSSEDRIAACTAMIDSEPAPLQRLIWARFRRAEAYLKKGEFDLAIADYDQVVQQFPDNVFARMARAYAHCRQGNFAASLRDYEEVIRLQPQNAAGYLGRASTHMSAGNPDEAIADYAKAMNLHPDNVRAFLGRAAAYGMKEDLDLALADCNRAIEISPERESGYVCRGEVYRDKDDFDRALADFDRAVQLSPKNPGLYFLRGMVRLRANLLPGAIEDFNRSSDLNPKRAYTRLWLDIAQRRSGQSGQLVDAEKQLDMDKWPAPIVRLFLGEATLDTVLVAADDPSVTKKKGQICEANFYGGELALVQGATEDAVRLLHLAADGCPKTFVEWPAAIAELHRLDAKP